MKYDDVKHNCMTCKNIMSLRHEGQNMFCTCYIPEVVKEIKISAHEDCHYYAMDDYYRHYPEGDK